MSGPSLPSTSEIDAVMRGATGPAWIIDTASGTILASNGPGRALLALAPGVDAHTLDRAMPALAHLAAIAASQTPERAGEPLDFWTRTGVVSLHADIRPLHPAAGGVVLVTATTLSAPATPHPASSGASPSPSGHVPRDELRVSLPSRAERLGVRPAPLRIAGAASARRDIDPPPAPAVDPVDPMQAAPSAPAGPRQDAATLREIARRIRAGRDLMPVEGEPAVQAAAGVAASPPPEPQTRPGLAAGDLAKLAHELRTPLAAIAALAEIMRDERLGPVGNARYRGYAGDIHDSARHALDVLSAGLDRERGTGEGTSLDFAELDLAALVAAAVSSMRPLAERAALRLSVALGERLPRVVADRRSLRQILLNLLSNALKFTPAGGEIRVATIHQIDGPLHLEVADTGSGMSAAEIARALSASDDPVPLGSATGGLGYGLPLVRTLAAANGAEIAIASLPGQGTRVTLTFPRNRLIPV